MGKGRGVGAGKGSETEAYHIKGNEAESMKND